MFTCGALSCGLHGMKIGHNGEITSFSDLSCNRAFVTSLGFPIENSDACITSDSVMCFFPVPILQVSATECVHCKPFVYSAICHVFICSLNPSF